MSKTCSKCHEEKPLSEFYKLKSGIIRSYCKVCSRRDNQAWHEKNKPYRRSAQLKYHYGITLGDYEAMLATQSGACAICGKTVEANGKYLAVDHDHGTKKVRALLCDQCNCGLGNFDENRLLMLRAIEYLEKHGA